MRSFAHVSDLTAFGNLPATKLETLIGFELDS